MVDLENANRLYMASSPCMFSMPVITHSYLCKDERASGAGVFLSKLGVEEFPRREVALPTSSILPTPIIFSISDASGIVEFSRITEPPSFSVLRSSDAFLVDTSHYSESRSPAVYVWIGREASLTENRLSLQYAQKYLHEKQHDLDNTRASPATPIIRIKEGSETSTFLELMVREDQIET